MKSFFEAYKAYKKDPGAFLGKPKLPHYKKKGGQCTAFLSNQECVFDPILKTWKVPLTKTRLKICKIAGRLKQVKVCPAHGVFVIHLIFEQKIKETQKPETIIAAATAFLSNQECVYDPKRKTCKLPLTKTRLKIGKIEGRLKQVIVCPAHGVFVIHMIFEQKI